MSTQYWSDDGYGIYQDNLKPTYKNILDVMLKSNQLPKLKEFIKESLDEELDLNKLTIDGLAMKYGEQYLDDLNDDDHWETYGGYISVAILTEAIEQDLEKLTGEKGSVLYSYNGETYDGAVMYLPSYPWYFKENNIKLLDQKEYAKVFDKWIRMFGVKENCSTWDWVTIEHWG